MDPHITHTLGQYQILGELGRGGMGIVYKAWQPMLKRYVAIKILPPQFSQDAEFTRRFQYEAQNAAGLNHPNIVHIYDFGIQQNYQFLVMELIEGETLQSYIARNGALSVDTTANILTQIANALDYAHARKIIHRDLKPANIMLTRDHRAILTDFGIAKALEGTQIARSSHIIGTPAYMSPEQIQARAVTAQSDIYSLGIVVYEMLTGRVPFQGNTATLLHAHVYQAPPPLRSLNRQISPQVENAVTRALAKNPAARYANAAEFAQAVEPRSKPQEQDVLPQARASSMRRFFGLLIDMGILFFIWLLLIGASAGIPTNNPLLSFASILLLFGFYGYFVFMWMLSGQTIGQMVLGIRVVSNTGTLPSWWQATKRWFVQTLTIVFGASIIFYILLVYLWRKDGKPPHDQTAGTEGLRTSFVGKIFPQLQRDVSGGSQITAILAGTAPYLVSLFLVGLISLSMRAPAPIQNVPPQIAVTEPTFVLAVNPSPLIATLPPTAAPIQISTSIPTLTPVPTATSTRISTMTATPLVLIERPASELNLQLSDLGSAFALTEEQGKEIITQANIRDASYRLFKSDEGIFVESTLVAGYFRLTDTIPETLDIVQDKLRSELKNQTITFGNRSDVSLGERAGAESFVVDELGASGYVLTFIQQNVLVILIEFGPTQKVQLDDVVRHGRAIEERLR